ncbi:MAG: sulfatase-like hydrolase/transferase [Acidobacteria bacterium]|nr:sulfatase-like hydrolase/transferase [Acidobacteriota bacterium]
MSGKTWFNVDTSALKGVKLLPELPQENGYVTFATGKWHNGQESWLRAFQRGKAVMFGGMSDHTKVPVRDLGPDGKLTAERTGRSSQANCLPMQQSSFSKPRWEKPFFEYVAFTAPHDPRQTAAGIPRDVLPQPAAAALGNFLPQLPLITA